MEQYEIQQIGCSVCQQGLEERDREKDGLRDYEQRIQNMQMYHQDSSSGNMWLWVALIIVLVLLVLYFLMKNKKNKNGSKNSSPPRRR
jgi:hypothetical protein